MNIVRKNAFALILGALSLMSFSGAAYATPITADISTFSVVHLGSNPAGTGSVDDWYRFDSGQTLDLDYTGNMLELIAPQSFSMSTNNGAVGVLNLVSFSMDLNDTDGFLGGSISYTPNGDPGLFLFADENYTSIYNTSSVSGGVFSLSIWGGDEINDLGLDLGITAQVPEPGALLLVLTGFVAFRLSRRVS